MAQISDFGLPNYPSVKSVIIRANVQDDITMFIANFGLVPCMFIVLFYSLPNQLQSGSILPVYLESPLDPWSVEDGSDYNIDSTNMKYNGTYPK